MTRDEAKRILEAAKLIKPMTKPIDRSKKSNRRCCNCEYCPEGMQYDFVTYCRIGDKQVSYWNCCHLFEWSSRKTYKENDDEMQ